MRKCGQDVVHKATINVVEVEKCMAILIKPQAHPMPSLRYILKGPKMGLVNWN